MFETLQFLIRMQIALGKNSIISIGKWADDVVMFSVTWKGGVEEFTSQVMISSTSILSAVSDEMMENMLVQRLLNEHTLWEVGEI